MSLLSRRNFLTTAVKLAIAAAGSALLPEEAPIAAQESQSTLPLIIDGHIDFGWNILNFRRDYTRSALQTRVEQAGTGAEYVAGKCMVGLPEMLQGRVALVFGAIFTMPRRLRSSPLQLATYQNAADAEQLGWRMIGAIEALPSRSQQFMLVRTVADLEAVLASWTPGLPESGRKVGIILAMEGADPIASPDQLGRWYERGLRSVGLSWGRTRYAGGNVEPSGLTESGAQLLRAMKTMGLIFDTAHLAEQAFYEALKVWEGTIVCTHGVPRHFLNGQRALSDDQIRKIIERRGVMGIGMYNGFFQRNRANPNLFTLADVINAIDHVCQLAGNCEHVALGCDFDGGFGAEAAPQGFNTIADLQQLPPALLARRYTPAQVNQIMHGNWLRILRENLPPGT